MARTSQARVSAYDALVIILQSKRSPNIVIEEVISKAERNLNQLDRRFMKEIIFGTLRWYSKIFWIVEKVSSRGLNDLVLEVKVAIIAGTYQIFYMDRVPDRASVNESVEYVRMRSNAKACTFVNGVLRQIARRGEYFAKPNKDKHPVDYLSLQYSHPKWMVRRWFDRFKFQRLEVILNSNNIQPPMVVRVNSLKTPLKSLNTFELNMLKNEQIKSKLKPLRSAVQLLKIPDLSTDSESLFAQGYYTVQGESSQLISYLVDPQTDDSVVDCCVGAGGKLTHLIELSQDSANFVALDCNKKQISKAQDAYKRLQFSAKVEWVNKDFSDWHPSGDNKITKILIDAPCSGLGVVRKYPESKLFKQINVIKTMQKKQKTLLKHALEIIPVGGEIVYSVCSYEIEETVFHLNWAIDKYRDKIEVVSPIARLPDYYRKYITSDSVLLIYSGNNDAMDGFGSFILRRVK